MLLKSSVRSAGRKFQIVGAERATAENSSDLIYSSSNKMVLLHTRLARLHILHKQDA